MKKALILFLCALLACAPALAVPDEIPEEARQSAWAIADYLIDHFEPLYQSSSDITEDLKGAEALDESRTEIDFLVDYNAVSLTGLNPEGEYVGAVYTYAENEYPAGLLRILLKLYGRFSTEYAREGETLVVVVSMGGQDVPIADEATAAAFLEGLEATDRKAE